MEFQYTLTMEEYEDFCKYELYGDPAMRKLKHRCWPILPGAMVFLFFLLYVSTESSFPLPVFLLTALAASIGWVFLVNYMIVRMVKKGAKDKCSQVGEDAFKPLHVVLEKGAVRINDSRQALQNYTFFSNFIILLLKDGSTLLLPARVFGESKEGLRKVLDALESCMEQAV